MHGTYKITVKKRNINYTLTLERNITILAGDSATGKTVLIKAVRDYEEQGEKSGIRLNCDKQCSVLRGKNWRRDLEDIRDSIVFIDEGAEYVSLEEFAESIKDTDNYYVIVTRQKLSNIPYSADEIYKLECEGITSDGVYNKQIRITGE